MKKLIVSMMVVCALGCYTARRATVTEKHYVAEEWTVYAVDRDGNSVRLYVPEREYRALKVGDEVEY